MNHFLHLRRLRAHRHVQEILAWPQLQSADDAFHIASQPHRYALLLCAIPLTAPPQRPAAPMLLPPVPLK
jgi:hypothetical protein